MENFDRTIRVITAILLALIAVRAWTYPTPVTQKDIAEFRARADGSNKDMDAIRAEWLKIKQSIPLVVVHDGNVSVTIE